MRPARSTRRPRSAYRVHVLVEVTAGQLRNRIAHREPVAEPLQPRHRVLDLTPIGAPPSAPAPDPPITSPGALLASCRGRPSSPIPGLPRSSFTISPLTSPAEGPSLPQVGVECAPYRHWTDAGSMRLFTIKRWLGLPQKTDFFAVQSLLARNPSILRAATVGTVPELRLHLEDNISRRVFEKRCGPGAMVNNKAALAAVSGLAWTDDKIVAQLQRIEKIETKVSDREPLAEDMKSLRCGYHYLSSSLHAQLQRFSQLVGVKFTDIPDMTRVAHIGGVPYLLEMAEAGHLDGTVRLTDRGILFQILDLDPKPVPTRRSPPKKLARSLLRLSDVASKCTW